MTVLKTGAVATDTSQGTLKSTIWTAVECHTAIICASLPMLKSTFAKFFPRFFPHSRASQTEDDDATEMDDDGGGGDDPIPSESSSPVNEDCEAAPVLPAWQYIYDPTALKNCKEAEAYPYDHEIHLSDISRKIPKVYCPKGNCPPIDVITKTTDIRVQYASKDEDDSNSNDSIYHYGSHVTAGSRPSRKSLPHRR